MAEPEPTEFPSIQRGGSLMVAWQVKDKHVLVVGGGDVAASRIYHLLNADARVTVIAPSSNLHAETRHRIATNQVRHLDRLFQPSDLDPMQPLPSLVLTAIDDPTASTEIYSLCHAARVPVNVADVPPECDFYFGSVHRDGPLQVMVSTNGKGPRLAGAIRRFIARQLGGVGGAANVGEAVERIGRLREKLREVAPEAGEGPSRMRWMSELSDKYSWEEMCELGEEDMENLLRFYPVGKVPDMGVVRRMRVGAGAGAGAEDEEVVGDGDGEEVFDGSFGFSIGV